MVERYLSDEMSEEEKILFNELRRTNAEVDQMVVEHHFFINQLGRFGEDKRFHSSLNEIHDKLILEKKLKPFHGNNKVVYLWNRYKRTITVAASIAGITALLISGVFTVLTKG